LVARGLANRSRIARVPLLPPWIATIVVAIHFPEPRLVMRGELDTAHPFRALPEVEMRNEKPRGTAMLRGERPPIVPERDPRLAARHVVQRQIRRVPAIRVRDNEWRGLHATLRRFSDQRGERDPFAHRVELRPLRDAVDIARDGLAWQRLELVPRPLRGSAVDSPQREVPFGQRRARCRSGREYRELALLV